MLKDAIPSFNNLWVTL